MEDDYNILYSLFKYLNFQQIYRDLLSALPICIFALYVIVSFYYVIANSFQIKINIISLGLEFSLMYYILGKSVLFV